MEAVVVAAGRGERFWPLTETRPKHLLPVAGRSVLDRTISALGKAGIREVLLVVNFQAEKIEAAIADGRRFGCRVRYIRQRSLKGTADALDSSREELADKDGFMAIYGDDYYDEKAVIRFVKAGRRTDGPMMAAGLSHDASRFGSLSVKNGFIQTVKEKVTDGAAERVNAGMYLLDDSIFDAISKTRKSTRGEFELTESIQRMIDQGSRVRAFPLKTGEWLGLTYPWDLLEANRLGLSKSKYRVEGKVEKGARVDTKVIIEKRSVVKSGSYVEGPVLIGEGSTVGPNSYLRPFTSLGHNVKIGAFCEVKNSIVMDNAKVPHLNYVGDSLIGENSSLGAGTITANLRFDEAAVRSTVKAGLVDSRRKKLGCIMGDNVRTGVNVSLLPGVKVGAGAWVGPGVVVHSDVPAGARIRS